MVSGSMEHHHTYVTGRMIDDRVGDAGASPDVPIADELQPGSASVATVSPRGSRWMNGRWTPSSRRSSGYERTVGPGTHPDRAARVQHEELWAIRPDPAA